MLLANFTTRGEKNKARGTMRNKKSKKIKMLMMAALILSLVGCGATETYYLSNLNKAETGFDGTDQTNTVSDPSQMGVGDVMFIRFGGENGITQVDFSGAEAGSEFYLGVASIGQNPGTQNAVVMDESLAYDDMAVQSKSVVKYSVGVEKDFMARLREEEVRLSLDESAIPAEYSNYSLSKNVKYTTGAGGEESFKVLASVSSVSQYVNVSANLYYEGNNVRCYVDTDVEDKNPEDLTHDDVYELCSIYDTQVDFARDIFGEESDVNGDDRVTVLMTPQVNRLGKLAGGVITGFFFATDLHAVTPSNQVSNEQEMIYMAVPDSKGLYGVKIQKEFGIENYMSPVFIHEFQHLISFNQKVFINKGGAEIGWLNEGLSHLSEDLAGYGRENYSRYEMFLNNPSYYSAMGGDSPGLGERGASYLFMRYLYEQHYDGNEFLRNLHDSNLSGAENLIEAFAGGASGINDLSDMFGRWMAALLMTNSGLTTDSDFIYKDRVFNGDTDNWQGVLIHGNAEDGRGTVLNGVGISDFNNGFNSSFTAGSAKFFEMQNPQSSLSFSGGSKGDFVAVLIRKY